MKKIIPAFLLFISTLSSRSQTDTAISLYDKLELHVYVTESGKKLQGISTELKKDNGILIQTCVTGKSGMVTYILPLQNCIYTVAVYKAGYYPKYFSVSTKKIPQQRMKYSFVPVEVQAEMIKKIPNIDFPFFLSNPFAKFFYDNYAEEFSPDFDYALKVMKESQMIDIKQKEYLAWKKDSFTSAQIIRADSFFYAANNKLKKKWSDADSLLFKQAINDYANAIKLKPNYWQAYRNKARTHIYLKQYEQAIIDLTAAISYVKDTTTGLYYLRGEALYCSGKYAYAIKDFDEEIIQNSSSAFSFLFRAKAKWKLEEKAEACEDYNKALKLNKDAEKQKEFLIAINFGRFIFSLLFFGKITVN